MKSLLIFALLGTMAAQTGMVGTPGLLAPNIDLEPDKPYLCERISDYRLYCLLWRPEPAPSAKKPASRPARTEIRNVHIAGVTMFPPCSIAGPRAVACIDFDAAKSEPPKGEPPLSNLMPSSGGAEGWLDEHIQSHCRIESYQGFIAGTGSIGNWADAPLRIRCGVGDKQE